MFFVNSYIFEPYSMFSFFVWWWFSVVVVVFAAAVVVVVVVWFLVFVVSVSVSSFLFPGLPWLILILH